MRALLVIFAFFWATWPASGVTQTTSLPASVAKALAKAGIPDSGVGVIVQPIDAERPLLAYAADRALNPGSTIKVLTTYAALELLGPAFFWNTEIYTDAALKDGVLAGNLTIKGYGDPQLTLENFWLLLRGLRARGVRDIRGDIVLDRTYFTREAYDPGRFDDQPTRPYNTGPDALLVNFKAITVRFLPDPEARAVQVTAEPPLPAVQILNNTTLTNGPCGEDWLAHLKIDAQGNAETGRIALSGAYPADCGEQRRNFSLLSHRAYFASLFDLLWKELGGSHSGAVRNGTVDPAARLLLAGKSRSLAEVIRDINKYSNNVMARQLFLTLGAAHTESPATLDKSKDVIRTWLAQKNIAAPELVLENGSGLSRIERISARNMARVLAAAYRSPVMPELIASLPLVSVDGTMRKRLPTAPVAGHAHIKTGTLSGVRAIAGYVLDAQGRRNVVVFMVNHPNAPNAQAAQDALLQWVYARGREQQ